VAILAGILPPTSAGQLERFATLPGWSVPDSVLARMRAAGDQRAEGIALAAEMVKAVRALPGVRGIHLMGLGPAAPIPEVTEAAGLLPRPIPG
jgi:methylenetetrahydrofolate reductase (NADPH)